MCVQSVLITNAHYFEYNSVQFYCIIQNSEKKKKNRENRIR